MLSLTSESMSQDGAYLIEDGETVLTFIRLDQTVVVSRKASFEACRYIEYMFSPNVWRKPEADIRTDLGVKSLLQSKADGYISN